MRESTIEDYLCDRVKAMGGEVRKVQWIGRKGAPDRLVMLPVRYVQLLPVHHLGPDTKPSTIWVELKAPGKKPTVRQLREHKSMRDMGQTVVVIDSLEGVDRLLA